jgi:uncharacterized protein YbaP (TraB family)
MKAALSRALIALLLTIGLAAPAAAAPAMWRISDEDSQVWLFGSVHAFNTRVKWRTSAFNKALKDADLVYFEMPTTVSDDEYFQAMAELGLNRKGKLLSDYLSKKQRVQLAQVVVALRLNPAVIESMRPWFAAMTISGIAGEIAGGSMRPGVEDSIKREIPNRKERGFDTLETQLRVLADLSDKTQVKMLMETITGGGAESSGQPIDLTSSWLGGDVDGLFAPAAAAFGKPGSELFNALLTKRNKRWAGQIEKLLDTDQDVMVIVGAAHFGGSSGLPALLKKRGIAVERVQ